MGALEGSKVLQSLLAQGAFDAFDALCGQMQRRWSLTTKDLNLAVAEATVAGDPRWLSSLLAHKLTQTDHMTGCSLAQNARFGWLRGLVQLASSRPDGWDALLAVVPSIPTQWSGAFGDFLTSAQTPLAVKTLLREVENREAAQRAWAEGRACAPGGIDQWQMSTTPLVRWMKQLTVDVMEGKDLDAVLDLAREQALQWVAQGADAGAWNQGTPAIFLLAPVEALLHQHSRHLVDRLVEVFDVLAPSAEFQVAGGSLPGVWWQGNHGMDMAQGLASFGAVHLARRAIHWGAHENALDARGRGWQWHAWANGTMEGVVCPADQLALKSDQGIALPWLLLENLEDSQDPKEVAQALRRLRDAGLDFSAGKDGVSLRHWAASGKPSVRRAWVEFEALVLDNSSPCARGSFARPRI